MSRSFTFSVMFSYFLFLLGASSDASAGAERFFDIVGFVMEKICKRKIGKFWHLLGDEARRLFVLVSPLVNQDAEYAVIF